MNIYVTTETSMTPVERAEALVAGVFSSLKALEDFLQVYPVEDFRTVVSDLMVIQDRVMDCAIQANRIQRNELLDNLISGRD